MAACSMQTERESGRTVIRLAGVFDHASAFELRERLEREPTGDLVLDFSSVRELADLGVAALAHGLAAGERRLTLRGLRKRQVAIFRYFGVPLVQAP
jgi:anti-anti-sigma regulatory factor